MKSVRHRNDNIRILTTKVDTDDVQNMYEFPPTIEGTHTEVKDDSK